MQKKSSAANFLKSLYAFLTIKQLLKSGKDNDRALKMSLENNFVTELTSLVVKRDNNADDKLNDDQNLEKHYDKNKIKVPYPSYRPSNRPSGKYTGKDWITWAKMGSIEHQKTGLKLSRNGKYTVRDQNVHNSVDTIKIILH